MALTKKQKQELAAIAEQEGEDYGFINYSHFEEIKDEKFRKLHKAWLDARAAFMKYIELEAYSFGGEKYEENEEDE